MAELLSLRPILRPSGGWPSPLPPNLSSSSTHGRGPRPPALPTTSRGRRAPCPLSLSARRRGGRAPWPCRPAGGRAPRPCGPPGVSPPFSITTTSGAFSSFSSSFRSLDEAINDNNTAGLSDLYLQQKSLLRTLNDPKLTRRCLRLAMIHASDVQHKVVLSAWLRSEQREDEMVHYQHSPTSVGPATNPICCSATTPFLECPKAALLPGYSPDSPPSSSPRSDRIRASHLLFPNQIQAALSSSPPSKSRRSASATTLPIWPSSSCDDGKACLLNGRPPPHLKSAQSSSLTVPGPDSAHQRRQPDLFFAYGESAALTCIHRHRQPPWIPPNQQAQC